MRGPSSLPMGGPTWGSLVGEEGPAVPRLG